MTTEADLLAVNMALRQKLRRLQQRADRLNVVACWAGRVHIEGHKDHSFLTGALLLLQDGDVEPVCYEPKPRLGTTNQ